MFYRFILINLPEMILCIMFGMLATGKGRFLPGKDTDIKKSIFKLFVTSSMVAFFNASLSQFLDIKLIIMLLTAFAGVSAIKFVYGLNWNQAFLGVLAYDALIATIEDNYMPFAVKLFYGNMQNFIALPATKVFYCTIIIRLIQILGIVSIWNWNVILDSIRRYKVKVLPVVVLGFLLLFLEFYFSQLYIYNFDNLNLTYKVVGAISLIACSFLNYMIFWMYIHIIKVVSKYFIVKE